MKLQSSELENGIRLIKLIGKLDSNGTYDIEIEFIRSCGGDKSRILLGRLEVFTLLVLFSPSFWRS